MSDALEVLSNDVLYGMMSESPDIAVALGLTDVAGRALPPAESAGLFRRRHAAAAADGRGVGAAACADSGERGQRGRRPHAAVARVHFRTRFSESLFRAGRIRLRGPSRPRHAYHRRSFGRDGDARPRSSACVSRGRTLLRGKAREAAAGRCRCAGVVWGSGENVASLRRASCSSVRQKISAAASPLRGRRTCSSKDCAAD